jgi:hypothetical protein|tara:strand:- start:112 stop:252 length:141 start_codon:yes stop_codon:yes gene_type:complete
MLRIRRFKESKSEKEDIVWKLSNVLNIRSEVVFSYLYGSFLEEGYF